jgi:hypothetical protein
MRPNGWALACTSLVSIACALGVFSANAMAAPQTAKLPGRTIDVGVPGTLVTDDDHTIALVPRAGVVRAIDATTGAWRDHDVSATCAANPAHLVAVGGGAVAFSCQSRNDWLSRSGLGNVLDLTSGDVHAVPELDSVQQEVAYDGGVRTTTVGAYGIGYHLSVYHGESDHIVDWRTNASFTGALSLNQVLDPNSPTLTTTMCSPLVRSLGDERGDAGNDYEKPYAITWGPGESFTVQRCGQTKPTVLVKSDGWAWPNADDEQLGGGFVSWTSSVRRERRLKAYLPMCGARLQWADGELDYPARHLRDAILIPSATGKQAWNLNFVSYTDAAAQYHVISLAGVCERLERAAQLTISGAVETRVSASARSGRFTDAPTGSTTELTPFTSRHRMTLRPKAGKTVVLRTGTSTRALRWRLGGGRWHAARGHGVRWTLRLQRSRGTHVLRLRAAFSAGGSATFELRVPAIRP